jgi:hypothetical protein
MWDYNEPIKKVNDLYVLYNSPNTGLFYRHTMYTEWATRAYYQWLGNDQKYNVDRVVHSSPAIGRYSSLKDIRSDYPEYFI